MYSELKNYIAQKRLQKDFHAVKVASTFLGELQRSFKDTCTPEQASKIAKKLLANIKDTEKLAKGRYFVDDFEVSFLDSYILKQDTSNFMTEDVILFAMQEQYKITMEVGNIGTWMKYFATNFPNQYDKALVSELAKRFIQENS